MRDPAARAGSPLGRRRFLALLARAAVGGVALPALAAPGRVRGASAAPDLLAWVPADAHALRRGLALGGD